MYKQIIILGVTFIMFNCAGTRPNNLGVKDGKLLACPDKPNCVSSQVESSDSHFIQPLKYSSELSLAFAELKSFLEKQDRVTFITTTDKYLNVEYKSKLMGYVDDVEFYFDDANKLVHVRSASRLGSSDWGVNRKRIESIREQLHW